MTWQEIAGTPVFVTIIEWESEMEPDVFVALTPGTAKLLAIEELRRAWDALTDCTWDADVHPFMVADAGLREVPLVADSDIDHWLEQFHELATVPWVTSIEKEIQL
jgi:hypothetical protein